MNKIYVISDTHFGHYNLIKNNIRPVDFEQRIMKNLYRLNLTEHDLLIHLGDFCWGELESSFLSLPCRKVLVKGNHDKKSYSYYYNHGFDFCCETFGLSYMNTKIVFSHKPLGEGLYDLNIHGHLHNNTWHDAVNDNKHYLISLELNGYKAENLNKIVDTWKNSCPTLSNGDD